MLDRRYEARRPKLDDASAIHDLITKCQRKVLGHSDTTLEFVRAELTNPMMDLEQDAWIVEERDGRLVGYGAVFKYTQGELVDINVQGLEPGAVDRLGDAVLGRAAE